MQQKTSGFIRAVKAIKRKHIDTTAFGNEIEILKTVDHLNIIKLYDCYHDQDGHCQISFEEFKTVMEKLFCFK